MKKVVCFILVFVSMFALLFNLTGNKKEFSFGKYVEYVTENVEPFPSFPALSQFTDKGDTELEKIGNFFVWLGSVLIFPINLIVVLVKNAVIILNGFFPLSNNDTGGSGDGDDGGRVPELDGDNGQLPGGGRA